MRKDGSPSRPRAASVPSSATVCGGPTWRRSPTSSSVPTPWPPRLESQPWRQTPAQRSIEFLTTRSMLLASTLRAPPDRLRDGRHRGASLCADVSLLATSRDASGHPGECVLHLPGLGLLPRDASPEYILTADAVKLHVSRAGLVPPRLAPMDESVRLIREIWTRPTASRSRSSWRRRVATCSPSNTRVAPERSLPVARRRRTVRLPRHGTLRATVDWSYEQLSQPERRFFRQLSVFKGTWSLEAATAVRLDTQDEFDAHPPVRPLLLEKSLVLSSEDAGGAALPDARNHARGHRPRPTSRIGR